MSNYKIFARESHEADFYEVVLHRVEGNHIAVHTHFSLLDDDGTIIEYKRFTREYVDFVLNNFHIQGDTKSFSIFKSDFTAGKVLKKNVIEINDDDIRHKLTPQETNFTSTGSKLAWHWPIFKKYRETGYASIIRATMTNHQLCTSRCPYCSTIARGKSDAVTLDDAKRFVEALYVQQAEFNRKHFSSYNDLYKQHCGTDIRLRGLILSGGGQPNLWKPFEAFVEWLSGLDIDLGLITNGFPESVSPDIYRHFKWIRISITPENASPHYVDNRFDRQYLPQTIVHNSDVTVGYSYVYGPWTTKDIIARIDLALEKYGFDYCRILADCNLPRGLQLRSHQHLAEMLFSLGLIDEHGTPLKKIFHQLKFHGDTCDANELWKENICWLQLYNTFWDTTGHDTYGKSWCYPCDSITVLSHDDNAANAERSFNAEKWGTVPACEVHRLFTEKVHSFFDVRSHCRSCLFTQNNMQARHLAEEANAVEPELSCAVEHVNFP